MSFKDLPQNVIHVIERTLFAEFATVSSAGVPIDTPTYVFPDEAMTHFGVATGIAYPAKANRARSNRKTGLLIEGLPGEPIISMRCIASVRDADLLANAVRYISETGFDMVSFGLDWSVGRKAVWYWTRMIVENYPERIMWWDNADSLDSAPHVWQSSGSKAVPPSDPAPKGKGSASPSWPQKTWQEIAKDALEHGAPAHLTMCDADGFPLPIPTSNVALDDDTFRMKVGKGMPLGGTGQATLSFRGIQTFVGESTVGNGEAVLKIERALPQLPMMLDNTKVIQPDEETRSNLWARLEEETARRGQSIPDLPHELPAPTRMHLLRKERLAQIMAALGTDRLEL